MKKAICSVIGVAVAPILFSCALPEINENSDVKEEKQYVTGSNLPKKDRSRVNVVSPEAFENAVRNGAPAPPAGR